MIMAEIMISAGFRSRSGPDHAQGPGRGPAIGPEPAKDGDALGLIRDRSDQSRDRRMVMVFRFVGRGQAPERTDRGQGLFLVLDQGHGHARELGL